MSDRPTQYVLPEDGIHMNKTGHDMFARKMYELVNDLLLVERHPAPEDGTRGKLATR